MKENLKTKILKYIFVISKQPVLFRDLLEANALYNEGMLVDGSKLNFRFNYFRTYQIYTILCFLIFTPMLFFVHHYLSRIDSHISIIGTVLVTSSVFLGFDMFKIWARKEISKNLIMHAWDIHFPYFPYKKYSLKIEEIYNDAIKNDISKKDLEQYVLERLVNFKPN